MNCAKPVTKERLEKCRYMMIELMNQLERIAATRERLESPINSLGVHISKHTYASDRLSDLLSQIVDFEGILDGSIKKIIDEIAELEDAIQKLDDPCEREILRLRYFEHKKWDDICQMLHFETSKVHRIHGIALENIYKLSAS